MREVGKAIEGADVRAHEAPALCEGVRKVLKPLRKQMRVLDAPMVLEITPDLGWTKGSAVRQFFDGEGGDRAPLFYAGDEANDTDAFEATAELGGISVGVGPRAPPGARHRLPDPPAFVELLSGFLEALLSSGTERV